MNDLGLHLCSDVAWYLLLLLEKLFRWVVRSPPLVRSVPLEFRLAPRLERVRVTPSVGKCCDPPVFSPLYLVVFHI